MRALKAIAGTVGFIGFLVGGVSLALRAHHYQVLAQPMPNGKGGFMTFRDGYYIAFTLIFMSVIWLLMARKYWRSASSERI
jgi:hypothetical protein